MTSAGRLLTAGLAIGAGLFALVLYLRSGTSIPEGSAAREAMKPSDRVRARLEQLRSERPEWAGESEGTIHAGKALQADPHRLPGASGGAQQDANRPTRAGADAPADADDSRDVLEEDPEDIPAMKKIALEDADPDRRLAAVTMLGASENAEAIPVLAQALSDSDEEVRMAALQALADFTDEPPVDAIENALNDPTPDIRFEALSVLADVGGDRARSAVEKALNDPDEDVRNLAEGILDMENAYEPTPAGAAPAAQGAQPQRSR